jgi:serine/threonine-protein kinase RsbW
MPQVEGIEAFVLQAGCTTASARNFAVVAEEILANIARHAWPGDGCGQCTVDVTAAPAPTSVNVILRTEDDGIAFDPTAAAAPDLAVPLQERQAGGLGIALVRGMTDSQAYRRIGDRNIFEVTRACPRT